VPTYRQVPTDYPALGVLARERMVVEASAIGDPAQRT
jgi:hypothetical protein